MKNKLSDLNDHLFAQLVDVIKAITAARCEARVKSATSGELSVDAWHRGSWIASTSCWPDGGMHAETLAALISDLADPQVWAEAGVEKPEMEAAPTSTPAPKDPVLLALAAEKRTPAS